MTTTTMRPPRLQRKQRRRLQQRIRPRGGKAGKLQGDLRPPAARFTRSQYKHKHTLAFWTLKRSRTFFWLRAALCWKVFTIRKIKFTCYCRKCHRYIKPNSKLPMLTQGIRADAANAMNNPTSDMFATAQDMCLDTLYAAVKWRETERK